MREHYLISTLQNFTLLPPFYFHISTVWVEAGICLNHISVSTFLHSALYCLVGF